MYGLTFLILAFLCFLGACKTDLIGLRIPLSYAGATFTLLGSVYLLRKPSWLLKKPSGEMRLFAWLLYGPYFLVNGLLFILLQKFSRECATAQIVPDLFLGRLLTKLEASLVAPEPVAVVDLVAEFSEAPRFRAAPGYLLLPVLDGTAPTLGQLQQGVRHIVEWLPKGRVYVHCALGHGRSVTLVAAFLLATGKAASVEDAIKMIRSRRQGIGLKPGQVAVLRLFESSLASPSV